VLWRILADILFVAASFRDVSAANQATREPTSESIASVVTHALGSNVQVLSGDTPYYLLGDFNGDSNQDLAVLVQVEKQRDELRTHQVKYLDIDPFSQRNGSELDPLTDMGHHCAGVVVLHGSSPAWKTNFTGQPYLFYECFASFRVMKRSERVLRGAGSKGKTPVLRGDAIQLDLETGGQTLVYWDGKTYRGFGQRSGD
jgi:hypothetical protein